MLTSVSDYSMRHKCLMRHQRRLQIENLLKSLRKLVEDSDRRDGRAYP